ncbi:MAG: hypothetical protein CMM47_00575 [Rhodospirillaceae bacterium]|nr:hypothetical protein [Rhodospirillaceae bacterium]MBM84503.1 hypothetical protein [Rhodospirillaceae bacterium]
MITDITQDGLDYNIKQMKGTDIETRLAKVGAVCYILEQVLNVLLVDTETTGVGKSDQIIELAILRLADGVTVTQQYFLPTVQINPHALAVHGLDRTALRMHGAKAMSADDVQAVSLLCKGRILVQWSTFDKKMWHQTVEQTGIQVPSQPIGDYWLDIMPLFAALWEKDKPRIKLIEACRNVGIVVEDGLAHSATYDCLLMQKLIAHHSDWYNSHVLQRA